MTVIYLIQKSGVLDGPVELPVVPGLGVQLPFNALELQSPLPPAQFGHAWCVVDGDPVELRDLRGEVYDTTTGMASQFDRLGELPQGFTPIPRPSPTHCWEGGTWAQDLQKLYAVKFIEINVGCEGAITSGFWSSALGAPHFYSSQLDDQLNLTGVVLSGLGSFYACRDEQGVRDFRQHSADQVRRVSDDLTLFKMQLLQRANTLKQQLDQALATNDIDSMQAIAWETER